MPSQNNNFSNLSIYTELCTVRVGRVVLSDPTSMVFSAPQIMRGTVRIHLRTVYRYIIIITYLISDV